MTKWRGGEGSAHPAWIIKGVNGRSWSFCCPASTAWAVIGGCAPARAGDTACSKRLPMGASCIAPALVAQHIAINPLVATVSPRSWASHRLTCSGLQRSPSRRRTHSHTSRRAMCGLSSYPSDFGRFEKPRVPAQLTSLQLCQVALTN